MPKKTKKETPETFIKDYHQSQRAVDVLSSKINIKEVFKRPVVLNDQECEDLKSLIKMFCLLRQKAFDGWMKER